MDYLNFSERKSVLEEIMNDEENITRKNESLMAFEIFKGRQSKYILSKMAKELGPNAPKESRAITSINLTKKIVKEQASLYRTEPIRSWSGLSEVQENHVRLLYEYSRADVKLKKANEIYKLIDQAAIQVVLKNGLIELRPLMGHHYDVIPKSNDPERADAYIISSFAKNSQITSDGINRTIGDRDDYSSDELFYWWTDEFNFITDRNGNFVNEFGQRLTSITEEDIANPIGVLPFVDVASDKDFEFFVRTGNNLAQMTIDLGVLLSDVTEIARLQGFSQGVISSVEQPKDMIVGPRRLVWLKVSPNDTDATRPQFSFVSPNPDLNASLQLVSNYLSLFLTSQGLSPKMISAGGESERFTSGVDRFLAMVEKFEASQDDMALFRRVEESVFNLMRLWNNRYYQATSNGLADEISGVFIPDDAKLYVKFEKPNMLMNESEKISLIEKRLELGLITRPEAISFDRGIDINAAQEIAERIDREELLSVEADKANFNGEEGKA